jgi:hypothetical protein
MNLINILIIISTGLFRFNNPTYIDVNGSKPVVKIEQTRVKAKEAFDFCKGNNFNTEFCILIDMSLHSGVKRFFIWDFKKDTVSNSFLVGHGCCDNPWSQDASKGQPVFSNRDGSHCSSLGKYKIGERGYSDWGVHVKYFMHGLESTNNNAFARTIVFHSWEMVADEEVYPQGTPEGWGCPTISNKSMQIIDPKLKTSQKPVLMWIYK